MTEEPDRCTAVGEHEWARFACTRRAGHLGEHRNEVRKVCWDGTGPVTDLQGRPLLKGTLQPSNPRRRPRRKLPGS